MTHERDDEKLEYLLSQRYVPSAPGGLAERIIAAAGSRDVAGVPRPWWSELADFFILPQPAIAFAACLVVGLFFGLEAEDFYILTQEDWSSFLYISEEVL